MTRPLLVILLPLLFAVPSVPALAQVGPEGAVRVTVPRANVRSEPSLRGAVLTQVTRGTVLPVQSVQGDWYEVRMSMGAVRFDAWISSTVCERIREAEPDEPEGTAGATTVGPPETRDGMSVGFLPASGGSVGLPPATARAVAVPGDETSLEGLARQVSSPGAAAQAVSGGDDVVWTWIVPGDAAAPALGDPQPRFIVSFGDLEDVDPADFTAAIVRLVPAPDGRRVLAAARGRADYDSRADEDWDVADGLRQDVVASIVTPLEPGTLNVQPREELRPGEYALVVRPSGGDDLAGTDVLNGRRAGVVFSVAWPFTVRPRYAGSMSAKENPSRSTRTPTRMAIDDENIGPAWQNVWNSPRSPHGSAVAGRSSRSEVSYGRPTNAWSSCFGSTQVSVARRPEASISPASARVGRRHNGNSGSSPVPASRSSR